MGMRLCMHIVILSLNLLHVHGRNRWDSGGKCLPGTNYNTPAGNVATDGYGACGDWTWSSSAGRCLKLFQGSWSNDNARTKCVNEGGSLFDSPTDGGWDRLRDIVPSGRDAIWIAPRRCAISTTDWYTHAPNMDCTYLSTKPSDGYVHSTSNWACVVFNRWANPWVLKWESKPCSDTYDVACQKWGACTTCAAGKKSAEGATQCSDCEAGKVSGAGAESCSNCAAGQTSTTPFQSCSDCPANTYAAAGAGSCKNCPTNSNSPAKSGGVTSCICNAGTSGPNGGTCTACGAGSYKASTGTATCDSCGAGKISTATGATEESTCTKCAVGKYSSSTSLCTSCAVGQYSASSGASTCTACSAGYFQASTNQNNCDAPCTAGKYSLAGASECTACGVGKYSTAGVSTCTSCTPGTYQGSEGQSSCIPCDKGKYYQTSEGTACLNCFNGQYQDETGQSTCRTCGPGEFTRNDNTAKSACTHCVAGNYQPNAGKTTCIECDPGTYQTDTKKAVCIACAAGMFSGTTGATHGDFCLKCMAGTYSVVSASTCTDCIKGKYTPAAGRSACTLCVDGEVFAMYAPTTRMTTCYNCLDKRQITTLDKSECLVCKDGEYEDRVNSVCVKCPVGKYSDGTTDRKCVDCREGTYATTVGSAFCVKCKACPDSFYRVGCTITGGDVGSHCRECARCTDPKDVRVDCMNRAGHNNAEGICRKREFTVRNPFCDNEGSGYFLGGYPFQELFGTSQDNADFQCRGVCDGVTNRLTDAMKTESNLIQYSNQSFDSGYCKGPYACNVPTCVIYGVSDDSQPAFRTPAACPVVIEDGVTERLWSVTQQASYQQHPLTVAVQHMRYSVECQACSSCGELSTKVMQVWPLMQNYTDWGRGCARECTELSCALGEIFDWTVPDVTRKCRQCSELEDVRLCTSQQQLAFAAADVSGNLPKLTFKDCQPKRILQYGIARASYGDCVRCPEASDACLEQPGLYYATCDLDLNPVCKKCDTRATALSAYFNGTSSLPLYCQKTLCPEDLTGVSVDVFPHRTCRRQCSKTRCAGDRVELPCLLPHDKRCKASMSYTDFPADELYKKLGYVPAHANVLERVSGLHMFSSFENVLLSVDSIPLQRRRVCVWNAAGIADNDMNPAGISVQFQEACRPWTREQGTRYPLLPMQNTVTDATEFQRRILLNTSAIAMHYLSQWQNVQRIPNVFTGDVFLDLDLTNTSHIALVAFLSPDRLLSNVTSVVRWHVSVYAQQTVGQRDDVLVSIDTPDAVTPCNECFSLQPACLPPSCGRTSLTFNTSLACSAAPHRTFTTAQLATAWQDFCGDKFHLSVPSGRLYACDKSMQRRVRREYTTTHTALSVLAGTLDTACPPESLFSIQMTISQDLIGGTEALAGTCCLAFVFSNTSVLCVSVGGLMHTISDARLHPVAFSIQSVVAYNDSLITTVSNRVNNITTTYVSSIPAMCVSLAGAMTPRDLNVASTAWTRIRHPIFMLATGNPFYFLSRIDAQTQSTVMLRKYNCADPRVMTATFCESDDLPVQLFSGNLPALKTQNTLLHARGAGLVFVTSTQTPLGVAVMMVVFVASQNITRKSVALATEAQDIVYPNNGEAHRISGCWISDDVYIVALDVQQQIWRLTLGTSIALSLLPPTATMFSYRFISLGGAVLTKTQTAHSLTTCMAGCSASTTDQDVYFAFGSDMLTYKRLLPCRDSSVPHVNPLDLTQTPAETCALAEFDRWTYWMQYELSFKCKQSTGVISMSVTLELAAVMRVTARDASMLVTANTSQQLSMHAQCVNTNVLFIEIFDHFACSGGCTLYQVSQILITGKVRVNYVLHTDRRPSNSMIYTQLHSSTYALSQPPLATSFDSWTQHSAFTHSMRDLQRIQVNLMRRTVAAFALSEPTHVALDVLQVVPVFNLQGVLKRLPTNETVLFSLVHLPSDKDLAQLAIDSTVRGSDISGWRRLHASAFVRSTGNALLDCVYDLRLVAIDDRFEPRQASSSVGCRVRLRTEGARAVGRCHIEVPFAMANSARVVGLILSQTACALPPVDALTVELNPFTSMSECLEHQFLDADTAKCAPCEMKDVVCGPGFYAEGCEAMLFESRLVSCLRCPTPTNARFTNASVTCNDWRCDASFFRSDARCLNCTTSLRTVCAKTKGQMWAACRDFENERCVDCPLALLPRNAEWTNTSECAWKCQRAYFNNNGICESCLSLRILKSVLSIQGTRAPATFYKFRPCTDTRQAEFSTCQFQQRLNATYTGDAAEFLNDCPVRCAEYLHQVNTTVVHQNTTWRASQCITCPLASEPRYLDGSVVPRSGYDMDTSCSATCRAASEHYSVEGVGSRCAFCPAGWCGLGHYATTADGCMSCHNCTSHLLGDFVFQREGLVNNNASCEETCAPGHYLADDGARCLPHTDVQCAAGQFKVNGTARSDARCDECTDCTGYRQVRACSRTQDTKCESCGPLVWWSSFWNGTACELACRPAYTKVYTPRPRCLRCSTCPHGSERVARPANCSDCQACSPPKPRNSEYIAQCTWKCEKYHVLHLDDETGLPQCVYSVAWSTNVPALPPRRQYNISCNKGQRLTDELLCEDCPPPLGLNDTQVNVKWRWTDVGCAWQCTPGLLHYTNMTANSTQNLCLTRAQYKALVVRERTPVTPPAKSTDYSFFLIVLLPLTVLLVCCGVLPRSASVARRIKT